MRGRAHNFLWSFLGALAFIPAACASLATTAPATVSDSPRPAEKVLVTGSRIPQSVDVGSGLPATISPVRVYARQDMTTTGRHELAGALRELDPSIGVGPAQRP